MSVGLSGEQLAKLEKAVTAGDRIAYYSLLAEFGDIYGKLALAVVNNDSGGGASANYFITAQAQLDGNPLTSGELATISMQLMQADFAARSAANGAELGYAQIQAYHQQVFQINGLTASAWTANFPLNYLGTVEEKQQLWTTLINSGSFGSASAIFTALADGWLDKDPDVVAYFGKLAVAGARGLSASSNEFGDYSVSIASGGQAIGGTQDSDTKSGTLYADVLMGFDGADTLIGGSGSDRLYGGAGSDVIAAGSLPSGFDPLSISYDAIKTESHNEWDDGEQDILVGGAGNDIYIVGGGVNIPNVSLTSQQVQDRAKLDLIDGADRDFTVYAQWVKDVTGPGQTKFMISAKLTSGDLAAATNSDGRLSFDTALSTVYFPEDKDEYSPSLYGQKVYDAVSKEAILYVHSMFTSSTNVFLFGIKNYVTFNPTSDSDDWWIEGDDDDNPDLEGTNGDDAVSGRGGDDVLDAATNGGGSDRYDGGDGKDTISYAASTQNLTISYDDLWGEFSVSGSDGESDTFTNIERIVGGKGNDTISGSASDETLAGGGGNDAIDGGGGINTIDFSLHTSSVTVQFTSTGSGTAAGSQSGQDTFTHIQNIVGSQGHDIITGDAADNLIDGQNGSDQIDGGAGYDVVAYFDTLASYTFISASNGYLQVWNYAYTDIIVNVEAFSFAGVDFLYSTIAGAVTVATYGTNGADALTGSGADDAIFGGSGNDTIWGQAGDDLIYGDGGDDVIFAGDGTNNVNGGDGTDTVMISGARSDFTIALQNDNSILVTGSGVANRIAGVEWITFDAPDGQEDVSLDVAHYIAANSSTTTTGSNANDTLTGTAGQDTIRGLGGDDSISGLDGDDTIDAGDGNDIVFAGRGTNRIEGGAGSDTVVIDGAFADFVLNVRDDNSILISGSGVLNTITGVETIVFDAPAGQSDTSLSVSDILEANSSTTLNGTLNADNLIGTAGQDTISGLEGNDTIRGLGGDDVIDAGAGNDVIFAGSGTNIIDGGDGSDTVTIEGNRENFMLQLVSSSEIAVIGPNIMNVIRNAEWIMFDAPGGEPDVTIDVAQFILDSSSQTIEGTAGADTLNGTSGADTIYGLGGNDVLYGHAGNDSIFGGDGDDAYTHAQGDGDDVIVENSSEGSADSLTVSGLNFDDVGFTRQGEDLLITVPESTTGAGDGGSILVKNTLFDDDAGIENFVFQDWTYTKTDVRSVLLSQLITTGDDLIEGFHNTGDYLEGGAGNDTFVFKPDFGWDTIGDFVAGAGTDDVLEFRGGVLADFEAVLAAASQVGNDTIVNIDGTNGITLANVNLSDLHRDDVRFVA